MQISDKKIRIYLMLFLPLGILTTYVCSFFPHGVEKYYSNGLNRLTIQALSSITGFFPFSAAEMILGVGIVSVVWNLIRTLHALIKGKRRKKDLVWSWLVNILAVIGPVYFGFILLWGLNYSRLPFADIAHLTVQPASEKDLAGLCDDLISRANRLRERTREDEEGVMQIEGIRSQVFDRSALGYERAAKTYPELGGKYGKPKGVFFSKAMSYTGIIGVYFPFTGEANVNTAVPDPLLPSTVCHEMAHQRGFAREDEANYLAYLSCTLHPDADFQYSGILLALSESMGMLRARNREEYYQVQKKYGAGVKRDLAALSAFLEKHEGPVERISSRINDLYLKSNREREGINSYNRMVDLLLAEYRRRN